MPIVESELKIKTQFFFMCLWVFQTQVAFLLFKLHSFVFFGKVTLIIMIIIRVIFVLI